MARREFPRGELSFSEILKNVIGEHAKLSRSASEIFALSLAEVRHRLDKAFLTTASESIRSVD